MKTGIYMVSLICVLGMISSCSKDSEDGSNIIFSTTFSSQEDIQGWSQSAGGQAIIDSAAVKFTNITDCYHFETINPIPVTSGKTYELHLTGKVNQSQQGDPMLCAGDFIIWVIQGNEKLISQSFGNRPAWTKKSYSFVANSSASVKIEFLIGTTRGVWIDDIELTEN